MSKHILHCDYCDGFGYMPLQGQPKESFPKGDWLKCPQCEGTRKVECYEEIKQAPVLFDIRNNPL